MIYMVGKKGMIKSVRWNKATMNTILAARNALVKEGWTRPTIRETLYRLIQLPGWSKRHYDTLTVKLGEWRDAGLIPFGLWSDTSGGNDYTPLTTEGISKQIEQLNNRIPAKLNKHNELCFIFIEHEGMTYDIAKMLNFTVGVVSSQGQLRREHLYTTINKYVDVAKELGGTITKGYALVDYDKGGTDIFEAHKEWLYKIFKIELKKYGVTAEQIQAAKLPVHESHQIDGWAAVYGYNRLKNDLLNLIDKR